MSYSLSLVTRYLVSFWKSESPGTGHTFSKQMGSLQLATTQLATGALNQIISDNLPGCTLCKATLEVTKEGKLSFHSALTETIIFSDEKTLDQWIADKEMVDVWQIEDLREGQSGTFYKLQRVDAYGYDTFETRDELFDQLREEFGVFWKLEDQGKNQTSYVHFKPGIFGSHYVDVNHEDIIFVANSLKLESPHLPVSTSHTSGCTSWRVGKGIAACVLGGLFISTGRSWSQSPGQNSVSDAISMMKGTLGQTAFKTAFAFQMSAIAVVSRQEGGVLPGALLAGMMFLPHSVKGQSLCPQVVGSYNTPGWSYNVALSGNYAYVADRDSGLQIIDVSNVTNPTFAGFYATPDRAYDVAVSGNYAYVADWNSGLQIIDVSNVANPTFAGSYDTPGWALRVALSGNYAYVADRTSGLQIIDVSNVANPTLASSYNTPDYAYGVALFGNYAYVADYNSGLQIIDVSNVANPRFAGSYNTPNLALDVAFSENYAYVADASSGLQIIDVSNVANPTLAGSYNTPDYALDVALSGNYAYVADNSVGGLQIIDMSDVANPTLADSYVTPGWARGVALSGDYVYVADGSSGLQIIKIPCPSPTSSSTTTSSSSTTSTQSSSSTTTTTSGSSSSTFSTRSSSSATTHSSFSTSSNNPTTTTILSSTTSPIAESSTDSSNPVASSINNPSSTVTTASSSSSTSTTSQTSSILSSSLSSLPLTTVSSPNNLSIIWIGLGIGVIVCFGITGGIVYIIKKRKQSSSDEEDSTDIVLDSTQGIRDSFKLDPTKEKSPHSIIGGTYYQFSKISKNEAQDIYEKAGYIVLIPEGKKKVRHVIGKGRFGTIKVAQRIENGVYVASKKVKGKENVEESLQEAEMQRQAAGANILPIYNTIELEDALYHFMPLAGYGSGLDIQSYLSTSSTKLATEVLKFIAKDLLTGLITIHEKRIYHLDIKPENLVFIKRRKGFITDFGCAKKMDSEHSQISFEAIGDTRYFSPDRLHAFKEVGTFDGEKADMWAAGVTLLQMARNQLPNRLFKLPSRIDQLITCTPEHFQERLGHFKELQEPKKGDIWWVIKGLLDSNASTRLTAKEALQASCFQDLKRDTQTQLFEELRKEKFVQESGMEKHDLDVSNYGWMARATRAVMDSAGKEVVYESQVQQKGEAHHYVTRSESYLLTPAEEGESYFLTP
ncbi:MAG: Serine/threonine-protein kinase PrkC [Chlamydiae bacterium]|nr:Serine/threonine-protein kinase PrkC [Chlamydiota bacterium]